MKKRIDLLLFEQGFAESRQKAQALILSGKVLVSDSPAIKAGQLVAQDAPIRIRSHEHPYVSRGALKLVAALDEFRVPVTDRVALDIGASTGGFTEVLLLRGIKKVFCVDVGYGQLNWKIRQDPKVAVFEKTNARYLQLETIGQKVDLIVVDVSFISLEKIVPTLLLFSHADTDWITLIKPQFEVGKGKVGSGGIVRSEVDQQHVLDRLSAFAKTRGLVRKGLIESPIKGSKGNKEFLAHWKLQEIKV